MSSWMATQCLTIINLALNNLSKLYLFKLLLFLIMFFIDNKDKHIGIHSIFFLHCGPNRYILLINTNPCICYIVTNSEHIIHRSVYQ